MKKFLNLLIAFLMVLSCSFPVFAQTPPDIIHNYTIIIDPQPDGSLLMKYEFNYEATTDFPSNIQYLEIGVANSDFEIVSYNPHGFITGVKANKSGTSQVHLDFAKLPLKDDKFQFDFVIKQKNMLYKADDKNTSFKFVPGWFDFAEIKELKVIINLKSLTVTKTDPAPTTKDANQMVWLTKDMKSDEKAEAITFICSNESYPNLQKDTLSDKDPNEGGLGIFVWILIIIVAIFIFIFVLTLILGSGDSYGGGGYSGGGRYLGGFFGGSSLGGGSSSSGRNSGGGGSFGGGGSSCACVSSCACACACAGGGRVGCSERGFEITNWLIKSQKQSKERDNE